MLLWQKMTCKAPLNLQAMTTCLTTTPSPMITKPPAMPLRTTIPSLMIIQCLTTLPHMPPPSLTPPILPCPLFLVMKRWTQAHHSLFQRTIQTNSQLLFSPPLTIVLGLRTLAWIQHLLVIHQYQSSFGRSFLRIITVKVSYVGMNTSAFAYPLC